MVPALSNAAMYKYTDDSGKVIYVDRLEAVPDEYRRDAEEIGRQLEKANLEIEERKKEKIEIDLFSGTGESLTRSKDRFLDMLKNFDTSLIKSSTVKNVVLILTFIAITVMMFRIKKYIGPRKMWWTYTAIIAIYAMIIFYTAYLKKTFDTYTDVKEKASKMKMDPIRDRQ